MEKFSLHRGFPFDDVYRQKAAERGFPPGEKTDWLFREWLAFWIAVAEKGEDRGFKTARGWLTCWDHNLKRKAANGTIKGSSKFETREQANRAPAKQKEYAGSISWSLGAGIAAKRKKAAGQPLDSDEQQALEQWYG
ncbi:MAG: hypothetical protein ACR2RF_32165 [Geminicoccaceae bacterium]